MIVGFGNIGGEVVLVGAAQTTIAIEGESRSMNLVGTALDGCLGDDTAGATELCRSLRVGDAELTHRFYRRKEVDSVDHSFVVVQAIEQEVVGLRTKTVSRK